MTASRIAAAVIVAGLMVSVSAGPAGAFPGQARQGAADPDLARLKETLSKAQDEIVSQSFGPAITRIGQAFDIIKAKQRRGVLPPEYTAEEARAHSLNDSLRESLLHDLETETVLTERIAGDMTRIEAGTVRKMGQLVMELFQAGGIGETPANYVSGVIRPLTDAVNLVNRYPIARLSAQEREARLSRKDQAGRSADSACESADPAVIERHIGDIEDQIRVLEQQDREAEGWRQFRKNDKEQRWISAATLRSLSRDLDRLEDALPRIKEAAGWVSDLRPAFSAAGNDLLRMKAQATEILSRFDALGNILARSLALGGPDDPTRRFEARRARAKEAENAIAGVMASLARVEVDLDRPILKYAEKWFKDTETSLGSLRDTLADLEERIASTDRFVELCEKALETGHRALARADLCLRTAPMRARPAPAAATPPGQGQAAAGGSANPPSAPPTPAAPAPQKTAAAARQPAPNAQPAPPVVPQVEQNVHGGIKIQGGAKRIPVGQSVKFVATDMGNRVYKDVIWNSHNEEFLSLGQDGTATGLKPGKLTIQAKTADDPYAIAYFEVEVVEAVPQPGAKPTGPAAGPAKPGPAAGGAAPAGSARPGTAQGSGGFGDRGLVVGPDKEKETGEKEKDEGVSLLGQAAGSIKPQEKVKPAGGDAGFGDKGLATGSGRDKTDAAGAGARQGAGAAAPPAVRPLAFQGGAQPAAWHIFATGSRLGWAAAHSRFTDGPADQDIVDHLVMAGEHAMWANRESYEPHRAWPNWSEIKVRFRTWAEEVVRDRAPAKPRESLAGSISSYAASMAEQVTFQVVGEKVAMPNCDGAYMRLGFHMAFGHTGLQLAEGALLTGRPELGERIRRDAVNHLRQAVSLLRDYEKTKVVTGSCADLRDVRAELEALLVRGDLGGQAGMAGNAWTSASERIRAVAGLGGVARPGRKPDPQPGTRTTPPAARPPRSGPQPPASAGELWADPGELEGTWVTSLARYRFERSGNDYVGRLERIFSPPDEPSAQILFYQLARQGYKDGDIVFRGTRTGPNSYRGTYQDRLALPLSRDAPEKLINAATAVDLAVLGDYLDIRSGAVRDDVGTSFEVWVQAIREGGVAKLPSDFEALRHLRRIEFQSLTQNLPIWFTASRQGPDGEIRQIVFQDHTQARSRSVGAIGRLDAVLRYTELEWKPVQDYVSSCAGLKRRLEEAGYTVAFGPSTLESCLGRIQPQ